MCRQRRPGSTGLPVVPVPVICPPNAAANVIRHSILNLATKPLRGDNRYRRSPQIVACERRDTRLLQRRPGLNQRPDDGLRADAIFAIGRGEYP